MKPFETPRSDYGKCGIPAIHSRLPDGPNIEYDDGADYLQTIVADVECDRPEQFQIYEQARREDSLDWGTINLKVFHEVFRSEDNCEYPHFISDEKRHGE